LNKSIENRLAALEDAHRALSAQHTALIEVFKITAPLMNLDRQQMRARLTILYDTIEDLMSRDGFDAEYRADVRHWLDVLSACVLKHK